MPIVRVPDRSEFDELPPERTQRWATFGDIDEHPHFPSLVGVRFEEIRLDYARMRLPFRAELEQAAGVIHGGVLATLVDTVVVPAIAAAYEFDMAMLTLSLNVQFLGAVRQQDMIAEGWVTKRGRTVAFCEAVVRTPEGNAAVTGQAVYALRPPVT